MNHTKSVATQTPRKNKTRNFELVWTERAPGGKLTRNYAHAVENVTFDINRQHNRVTQNTHEPVTTYQNARKILMTGTRHALAMIARYSERLEPVPTHQNARKVLMMGPTCTTYASKILRTSLSRHALAMLKLVTPPHPSHLSIVRKPSKGGPPSKEGTCRKVHFFSLSHNYGAHVHAQIVDKRLGLSTDRMAEEERTPRRR